MRRRRRIDGAGNRRQKVEKAQFSESERFLTARTPFGMTWFIVAQTGSEWLEVIDDVAGEDELAVFGAEVVDGGIVGVFET